MQPWNSERLWLAENWCMCESWILLFSGSSFCVVSASLLHMKGKGVRTAGNSNLSDEIDKLLGVKSVATGLRHCRFTHFQILAIEASLLRLICNLIPFSLRLHNQWFVLILPNRCA